jgi:ribosomal protein S13
MSDVQCGRRSCDREATTSFTTARGQVKARCPRHALADGVDGVGESRAAAIIEEIAFDDLVAMSEGADGTHAPPALSRVDGLGPTTAATVAKRIDETFSGDDE